MSELTDPDRKGGATVPDALGKLLWGASTSSSMHRILVAAAIEFSEKGFSGATTRAIARRADMSPAAVYTHFPSKERLLHHILLATHSASVERLRDIEALVEDPVLRLRELVKALVSFQAETKVATRLSSDLTSLTKKARDEIIALRAELERIVHQGITEIVGHLPSNREVLLPVTVSAIFSLTTGVSRWYRDGGRVSLEEIGNLYADMALKLVEVLASRDIKINQHTTDAFRQEHTMPTNIG